MIADLIAAAFVLTLWTWAAVVFVREWAAERRHKARVRQIAADTWARHQRQEHVNDIARHVTSAFAAAMGDTPVYDDLAAERLRAQLDDEDATRRWLA